MAPSSGNTASVWVKPGETGFVLLESKDLTKGFAYSISFSQMIGFGSSSLEKKTKKEGDKK